MTDKKQSVTAHPDYQTEVERLEFTKLYIDSVLEVSKSMKAGFVESVKEALLELDHLDSSASYISILTNARFLEMTSNQLEKLESVKGSPYFARINFSKREGEPEEVLYIGKTSLYNRENQMPIIVDWRSPVATVYYDGRLGEVNYTVNEQERTGYLSLKRQYKIENGKLGEIRDIDLTTHDELLQESLAGKADHRLTEIVSTIQKEQNDVIRAPLHQPIIVQGAAGSGKTTIALHRISYFLYTFSETFRPDRLMILAPNRLFNEYISAVLPDLGVEKIKQTTFVDYMLESLGKRVKLTSQENKLLTLLNGAKKYQTVRLAAEYKGSFEMKELLDRYVGMIEKALAPTDDFRIEKFNLMKGKKLRHLFLKEYSYLPVYGRLDKLRKLLSSHLQSKKSEMHTTVESLYNEAIDRAFDRIKDEEKRKQKVTQYLDRKEARIQALKQEQKSAVSRYMKPFRKKDIFTLYKELMTSPQLLTDLGGLPPQKAERLAGYCQKIFARGLYEYEDLAPLYYLQAKLVGIDPDLKMKSVFIDEAQDYSYFQFVALKEGLDTSLFTIVGDLAQGIYAYRGLRSWEPLLERVFPEGNYHSLQRSYRTTVEIMELANEVLALLPAKLPRVNPVVRHGEKPNFQPIDPNEVSQLVEVLERDIRAYMKEGWGSIAIIGKTKGECDHLAELLSTSSLPTQLLRDNADLKKGEIAIVPAYLAKGLEFDAVLIVSLNEAYRLEELDIKLLYVAMTRPLHRLRLYAKEPGELLLDGVNSMVFTVEK